MTLYIGLYVLMSIISCTWSLVGVRDVSWTKATYVILLWPLFLILKLSFNLSRGLG